MSPQDIVWHLAGFLLPGVFVGLIAAAFTGLVWRREVATVGWLRVAAASCIACLLASAAGLLATGRDGTMAGYGAMVLACAATQWWLLRRA